jgi:hypothetical protein
MTVSWEIIGLSNGNGKVLIPDGFVDEFVYTTSLIAENEVGCRVLLSQTD